MWTVSAGTSSERTTRVSSSTPKDTRKASWARNRIGSTDRAAKVAARTMPAELITPPVAASARSVAVRGSYRAASSRTRVIRKML